VQDLLTTGIAAGGGVGVVMAIIKSYQMLIERVPKPGGSNGHSQKILLICAEKFDNINTAIATSHFQGAAQGEKIDSLLSDMATLMERTAKK